MFWLFSTFFRLYISFWLETKSYCCVWTIENVPYKSIFLKPSFTEDWKNIIAFFWRKVFLHRIFISVKFKALSPFPSVPILIVSIENKISNLKRIPYFTYTYMSDSLITFIYLQKHVYLISMTISIGNLNEMRFNNPINCNFLFLFFLEGNCSNEIFNYTNKYFIPEKYLYHFWKWNFITK